jgi:hypothetical protein
LITYVSRSERRGSVSAKKKRVERLRKHRHMMEVHFIQVFPSFTRVLKVFDTISESCVLDGT